MNNNICYIGPFSKINVLNNVSCFTNSLTWTKSHISIITFMVKYLNRFYKRFSQRRKFLEGIWNYNNNSVLEFSGHRLGMGIHKNLLIQSHYQCALWIQFFINSLIDFWPSFIQVNNHLKSQRHEVCVWCVCQLHTDNVNKILTWLKCNFNF